MKIRAIWTTLSIACLVGQVQAAPWKFVAMGDTRSDGENNGVNTAILSELATAIVGEGVSFCLVVGDLANSGGLAGAFNTWKTTMQPVYGAGIGVYPVRGNHDIESSGYWNAAFGADLPDNGPTGEVNRTYSFTYANALIVGLDEYTTSHQVNQTWLNQQFAANSNPHVFVFGHEPAFKVNHTDCLGSVPTARNTFWNSIAAEGGRTYFCGHDHMYDHARIDNGDGNPNNDVHQYLVGNGGAPFHTSGAYDGSNSPFTPVNVLRDINIYGYVVVTVDGPNVSITYKHRTAANVFVATSDVLSYAVTSDPVIKLTPTSLAKTIGWGTNPPAGTSFTVQNTGQGTFDYTIASNAAWVAPSTTSGSCSTETDTIDLVFTTASLAPGSYVATLTVASGQATNSPQTVTVNLTVDPVPGDFDGDQDVDQEDFGHLQACLSATGMLPGCTDADFDQSGSVEQTEIVTFSNCMRGPNVPALPGCGG